MRHTRSHTGNRRSHHALKEPTLSACSNCGVLRRPHHMCQACGFYKGRQVMDMQAQKKKRTERMRVKRDRIRAEANDPVPQTQEVSEEVTATESEVKPTRTRNKKPEKKVE